MSETTSCLPSDLIVARDIFSLMCCLPGLLRTTLPEPVILNLFCIACRGQSDG